MNFITDAHSTDKILVSFFTIQPSLVTDHACSIIGVVKKLQDGQYNFIFVEKPYVSKTKYGIASSYPLSITSPVTSTIEFEKGSNLNIVLMS